MDPTTEYLSDYACGLAYEELSPEAIHQVKRTLVDSLGCAVGAIRQRAGVHRAAHGVSSPGKSSGAHPRHRRRRPPRIWRPLRTRFLSATSTVTTPTPHGGRAIRAT